MADIKLTPAQKAAVEDTRGAVLVSAAAGSGKTKVLVERLLRRVCDPVNPCNVDDFLIITFTKKAAAELRSRIVQELAERLAQMPEDRHLQRQLQRIYLAKISTIHSFCSELLREFAYELGIPSDFRMAEETECVQLRQRVMDQLLEERYEAIGEDAALRALVDYLGAGRDDRAIPSILQTVYDNAQCHLYPEAWLDGCRKALDLSQYEDAGETPWGASLIDRFRRLVAEELAEMEEAVGLMALSQSLPDKAAPLFERNIAAMRKLLEAKTWDEIYSNKVSTFGTLRSVKDCDRPEIQEKVKAVRSRIWEKLKAQQKDFYAPSEEILEELRQTGEALDGLFSLAQAFFEAYAKEKERLHVLDFNDLEHGAVRLLIRPSDGKPTRIAEELSGRFTEIMVDEYQDTNEVQDRLFKAISKAGKNRFMVGDVKQSIYRFRLADPSIFLHKYKTYADHTSANDGEPRRILLSENFRSRRAILDAANAVFSACMSEQVGGLTYGPEEALKEGRPHLPLPASPVELHCISTDTEEETPKKNVAEAQFVAARLRRLLDEKTLISHGETLRPVQAGDVVVLLRSLKSTARYFVEAFSRQGIPCVCDSGSSILDTQELESLVSLLQLLDNSHQDIPLAGVMLSPVFGFSAEELAQVRAETQQGDLYDALVAARDNSPRIAGFLQTVEHLRDMAEQLPIHGLLEEINRAVDFELVYGAMPGGQSKQKNFRRFCELAAAFEDGGSRSLHQFLAYLESLKEQGVTGSGTGNKNAVTILSIHKSKGLEFPVVVLPGLSRKFNLDDIKQPVLLHPTLGAGCNVYDAKTRIRYPSLARRAIAAQIREENLSEELRVLYVAMTRPKDMLIMTYCSENLRSVLEELAPRLTLPPKPSLAAEAKCPGFWVLMAAMLRTEAGELFRYGAKPEETADSDIPWKIKLHEGLPEFSGEDAVKQAENPAPIEPAALLAMLGLSYPGSAAASIPSKITATQLKGRLLDDEVSTGEWGNGRTKLRFQKPSLLSEDKPLTPAERGVATHLAMQYLDFGKTETLEALEGELSRLVAEEYLTPKQAEAVSPQKLLRIFEGSIGQAIQNADRVIREFKFSVLVDARRYFPEAGEEQIMLQGVVDCCLVKNNRLTVIDFKTDRIRPGEEAAAAAGYRGQLEAYSLALSKVFGLPVEKKILYFFQTDQPIEV